VLAAATKAPAFSAATAPRRLPVFDAHLHIIDRRFPLVPNRGYLPRPFTCEDYRRRMKSCDLRGGAVVSGSFQGLDSRFLVSALETLGPAFVGVAHLPATVSAAEVLEMDRAGVRAVRFNLVRGAASDLRDLERLAHRVHEIAGWHVEVYAAPDMLIDLYSRLAALPAVSIDHLGLGRNGFATLLRLVARGVRVKASGFGRVDFDIGEALRALYSANPEGLMFGTDLPSTRAPRVYSHADLGLVLEALGDTAARQVLYDNAVAFYRPRGHL
jgi:predicted TIM-barrel fold metal-dependent hydrolase